MSTDANALETSRLIEAPPEAVFRAISDPAILARWWGPKGFRNTFEEFAFVPGGTWRFVMHGPNGGDYRNESVFDEIVEPERVVVRHLSPPAFTLTIALTREGTKTRVGWRQVFPTAEECERIARFARDANEQNLDRLEAEVRA